MREKNQEYFYRKIKTASVKSLNAKNSFYLYLQFAPIRGEEIFLLKHLTNQNRENLD